LSLASPPASPPPVSDGSGRPPLPWWTWCAPLIIFHMGTGLSLQFQVSRGVSLWYLPVPLGIILVHWWGPRVLVGLYLNAMLCAGYWGLYRWWLWPLYAIPETVKVGLSWWLFASLFRGRCWLPDLRNTWGFLLLGILVPSFAASYLAQGQLALLGDIKLGDILKNGYTEFVLDLLSPFAIAVPVLLFCTSFMERSGLTRTSGADPRPALLIGMGRRPLMVPEAVVLFASLLTLSFFVSLDKYWFVYGVFLLWSALRWGIGLASLAALWTIIVALLLPYYLSGGPATGWMAQADVQRVNLNLATLCFASLVVGRALSDRFQEIDRRAAVEADLRETLSQQLAMEQTVAEEQAKYRTLFESARDAIALGDKGVIVDCNGRALEMFRASREEYLGSPVTRFFPAVQPDGSDAAERMTALRNAALEGTPQHFEWRMRRLDGEEFDADVSFVGVTVGGRRVNMAVIRDVTQRKAMAKALEESEAKYRTLFESASDSILLARRGRILDCNPATLSLFRCTRENLLSEGVQAIYPPFQPDGSPSLQASAPYRDAALAGSPQRFEWTYRRFDGTSFEAEVSLDRFTHDGETALIVAARDISARKRIERALVDSEERFRQMAENIEEIFFLLDCRSETMLYVSPMAATMLGIPLERIARRPLAIDDYTHPDDRVRMGFFVDGAWKRRAFNEDFRFQRPDGQLRWLRLKSFLIRDHAGAVYRVAGVVADITEYKVAQEEARANQQRLIQADKMNSLGLMVSGVAHEINNPNNLIMLNTDVIETFWKHMRPVLREHHAQNPDWRMAGIPYAGAEGKVETLLSGVRGGSQRIKRIVDNLKDFARTDGGDLSESVSLDKVVEASVGIVENLIRKTTDRFSVVAGKDLPRVRGNFQKLEQVVINLITNACQALEGRDKAIRVITWHEKEKGLVGVRVEDEGKGIPEDLIGKVADPFFTTKRDTGGTGLGLSVTYGIVREHRGLIEFKSEENRGTTVEVRIPVQQEKT
jgi:PAS domain S-box-containing protein